MQKPDTTAYRSWARWYATATAPHKHTINYVLELCDYIDSIDVSASEITFLVDQHAEKAAADAKAQIREFVATANAVTIGPTSNPDWAGPYILKKDLLDFIDNGPKKPTVREVISDVLRDTGSSMVGQTSFEIDAALRTAGLLKEDNAS